MSTALLLALSVPYILGVSYVGGHSRRARLPAFLTGMFFVLAMPLLPDANAMAVDRVIPVMGLGRLLTHLGFMSMFLSHYLMISTVNRRSARKKIATVTASVATFIIFATLWGAAHGVRVHNPSALYYGSRRGIPTVLWLMNVVMGGGLTLAAFWNVVEYIHAARAARARRERLKAVPSIVLFLAAMVPGLVTVAEATARHLGRSGAGAYDAKMPVTVTVVGLGVLLVLIQVFVWPLWEHRKELALRYARPEWLKLRGDIVDLIVYNDQKETENHSEVYANRQIVDAVDVRCVADDETPEDCKLSVEATRAITNRRANVIDDPDNVEAESWDDVSEDMRRATDELLAGAAWDYVGRQIYFLSDKMLLIALVLGPDHWREQDHREPDARHWRLARRIATVMGEFGQPTPLLEKMRREECGTKWWDDSGRGAIHALSWPR